ncbi:hypothetical protein SAMN05428978_11033 [Nitrosomonas sp. Nm34]|nr:hypothetical protein SAMN05428978_11033 [Nitrosomonas sp. Nm34]
MCKLSGNGDFLVIRAAGKDAYNPYIQQLAQVVTQLQHSLSHP